jgi:catechol 2,3-dioxygenase-like lactoylglutathione lyase family enzyme
MSETAPLLNQFNLVVQGMEATLAFYRKLGLPIRDTDPAWAMHHRSAVMANGFSLDFDSMQFASQWNSGWPGRAGGGMGVLGFALPSREAVAKLYADLTAAGYKSQQTPFDAFWGARYAVIEDPDGNAVGLMSPMDESRQWDVTPPSSK